MAANFQTAFQYNAFQGGGAFQIDADWQPITPPTEIWTPIDPGSELWIPITPPVNPWTPSDG